MEISWLGLITFALMLSVFIRIFYLKIKDAMKDNKEEKNEELKKEDSAAKKIVMVEMPLEDALALQGYIQAKPIQEAINFFNLLANAISMALSKAEEK